MKHTTVEIPYEFNGKESIVKAKVSFGYDGIGSYEFWGAKCYDRGNLCCDEIIIESINGESFNNDFDIPEDLTEKIEEKALEKLQDQVDDYPEPDLPLPEKEFDN